ncbi:MAG: nitrilase-related carbon-nitrogen hydrolase, partial [Candidatus Limnocylindrales bacterium]
MRLPVALVQVDATGDVPANIERATALAAEAARAGARLVVLPEYLQYRGPDEGFRASARQIPGPHTDAFAEVARRHDAWILPGSLAESSDDDERPFNTSVLIAPDGSIAATYRKIHLFDVAVDAGP